MSPTSTAQATMSSSRSSTTGHEVPGMSTAPPTVVNPPRGFEDEDEDDDRLELTALQAFESKVQRSPYDSASSSRVKILIPKRGEKDFEPLAETVNLQEMVLQRSREALFGALVGVRGGNSKLMSHAVLAADADFPRLIVIKGHLFDTMGISVRYGHDRQKPRTYVELLPEEALYMLERGSLTIWRISETSGSTSSPVDDFEWSEEVQGVRGAVEMSVQEGFATFLGRHLLSWERYQAYAFLKRLGYTVQRTRKFLPKHFCRTTDNRLDPNDHDSNLTPFKTWWLRAIRLIVEQVRCVTSSLRQSLVGLQLGADLRSPLIRIEALAGLNSYNTLLRKMHPPHRSDNQEQRARVAPHDSQILLNRRRRAHGAEDGGSICNPYLPFWHVWKPATPWTKQGWDMGSVVGFRRQRPEYSVAVIEARRTPLPTQLQLQEVFDGLSDEPTGPTKKVGPQYARPTKRVFEAPHTTRSTLLQRALTLLGFTNEAKGSSTNPHMGFLRNGDRALIVAVNDSGNTGWVRFGRTDFTAAVVP